MTYSLAGETIPSAGTPEIPNCRGTTVSAMAHQFGGIKQAAVTLGYSSVRALQRALRCFVRTADAMHVVELLAQALLLVH